MAPPLTFTQQVQQHIAAIKLQSLAGSRPFIPLTRLDVPPPDARPFVFVTRPYPVYPAPGAAAVVLLTYVVPPGFNSVINLLGIFQLGGGIINGTGQVIWRVLVNDTGWKGMDNIQSQFGSDALPLPTFIHLVENDIFKVTAEVPAGQQVAAGTTGARIHGFEYPAGKTT